jgi:hypothetical protein
MFRYSICDPLKQDPIEMGEIGKEEVLDILDRFPWTDLLDKMKAANESDIHFSPSLEFENKSTRHGLAISIIEEEPEPEFCIFYKRPKMVTRVFGLIKKIDNNYSSDRFGQTKEDVRDAVLALMTNDTETLERRWG